MATVKIYLTEGTIVKEDSPTSNYSNLNYYQVGITPEGKKINSLMRGDPLPAALYGATITSAKLYLYSQNTQGASSDFLYFNPGAIVDPWNTDITWDSKPEVFSFSYFFEDAENFGWISTDITSAIRDRVQSDPEYYSTYYYENRKSYWGFVLETFYPESYSGVTKTFAKSGTYRPYIQIEYQLPTALPTTPYAATITSFPNFDIEDGPVVTINASQTHYSGYEHTITLKINNIPVLIDDEIYPYQNIQTIDYIYPPINLVAMALATLSPTSFLSGRVSVTLLLNTYSDNRTKKTVKQASATMTFPSKDDYYFDSSPKTHISPYEMTAIPIDSYQWVDLHTISVVSLEISIEGVVVFPRQNVYSSNSSVEVESAILLNALGNKYWSNMKFDVIWKFNTTTITSTQSYQEIHAPYPAPEISNLQVTAINPLGNLSSSAISAPRPEFIEGVSTVKAQATCTSVPDAPITSITWTIDEGRVRDGNGNIPVTWTGISSGEHLVQVEVTNSLGVVTTDEKIIEVIPYSPVIGNLISIERFDNTGGGDLENIKVTIFPNIKSLSPANENYWRLRLRRKGPQGWEDFLNINDVNLFTGRGALNTSKTLKDITSLYFTDLIYDIEVEIMDEFSTFSLRGRVLSEEVPLSIGPKGIGLGKIVQGNRILDIQGPIWVNDTEVNLLDLLNDILSLENRVADLESD